MSTTGAGSFHLQTNPASGSRLRHWAWGFVLVHLAILGLLAATGKALPLMFQGDTGEYLALASYPVTDGIYSLDGAVPSAKREPGCSWFIMLFMLAGLVKPHVATVANLAPIIIGQMALYGWVSHVVASETRSRFGGKTGWVALLLLQASPLAKYQYIVQSECLTMCLLGLVWAALFSSKAPAAAPGWARLGIAALCCGFLCITRSVNVIFVPVLALGLWLVCRTSLLRAACFMIVTLIFPAGWMQRNQAVLGLPIMGSIDGFSSLYRGNVLPFQQIPSPDDALMPREAVQALAKCKDDAERYRWYKAAALSWLAEHPVEYARQCLWRTAAMFVDLYRGENWPWWQRAWQTLIGNYQLYLVVLPLLCGRALWRQRDPWSIAAVVFLIFNIAIYAAVYGIERYMHPALFTLAPLNAWCICHLLGLRPATEARGSPPTEAESCSG